VPHASNVAPDPHTSSLSPSASSSRYAGFGSEAPAQTQSQDWYASDRYAVPTVEIAETNNASIYSNPSYSQSSQAEAYQPPAAGSYGW